MHQQKYFILNFFINEIFSVENFRTTVYKFHIAVALQI